MYFTTGYLIVSEFDFKAIDFWFAILLVTTAFMIKTIRMYL